MDDRPDLGGIAFRWCGFCGAKQAYSEEQVQALRFPEIDLCPRCGERAWRSELDEITAPDHTDIVDR